MPVYAHVLYVCTQTASRKQTETHPPECKQRERERGGEIRGGTQTAPTPIDSKEAWTPFFNKPTLHVPGSPSQQIHSAAYPREQESRSVLISTARDWSRPFKEAQISPVFDELSSGQQK